MPSQDLRFRRRVQTIGELPSKNKFSLILVVGTAVIIVPALIYAAMHPEHVSSTVKQIVHYAPLPVKDIGRIAVVAQRSTPVPQPSPTASSVAIPTPTPNSAKATSAAEQAHQAHLKRARALAAAAAGHAKKLASIGQTSDISRAASTGGPSAAAASTDSGAPVTSNATATPAAVSQAPSQPVADATPVYAPEIVVDARFTREVHPDYPEIAKQQGAQGTAVVLATIGPNGNVISARIDQTTGNKLLDSAALSAARQSGFEPPKINGKPATETYRLVYTFSL